MEVFTAGEIVRSSDKRPRSKDTNVSGEIYYPRSVIRQSKRRAIGVIAWAGSFSPGNS